MPNCCLHTKLEPDLTSRLVPLVTPFPSRDFSKDDFILDVDPIAPPFLVGDSNAEPELLGNGLLELADALLWDRSTNIDAEKRKVGQRFLG